MNMNSLMSRKFAVDKEIVGTLRFEIEEEVETAEANFAERSAARDAPFSSLVDLVLVLLL
jgi:hypothetical protein